MQILEGVSFDEVLTDSFQMLNLSDGMTKDQDTLCLVLKKKVLSTAELLRPLPLV